MVAQFRERSCQFADSKLCCQNGSKLVWSLWHCQVTEERLGGEATGVGQAAEQMISAGLKTGEKGCCAKVHRGDPRGISKSKTFEQKKDSHSGSPGLEQQDSSARDRSK